MNRPPARRNWRKEAVAWAAAVVLVLAALAYSVAHRDPESAPARSSAPAPAATERVPLP